MDAQQALKGGRTLTEKAEAALARPIHDEADRERVQVQVGELKAYLADSEPHDGVPEVRVTRAAARGLTMRLDRRSMEFKAAQEGHDVLEVPEDLEGEDMAEALVYYGDDFVEMAGQALRGRVRGLEDLAVWEDPLQTLKEFLADSEPYVPLHPRLADVRVIVRQIAQELERRIHDVRDDWRAKDLVDGDDEDD